MNGGTGVRTTRLVLDIVSQVTIEEFYRHDSHFNRDSRLGRELLYLIANDNWARSTTEIINLSRSDAVDTTIAVNVDLGKITHEAFQESAEPIWLPLLVLPALDTLVPGGSAAGNSTADGPRLDVLVQGASAGQLTVTDATGTLLAPMREADVWHAISAALAEIMVNMADTFWFWPDEHAPADRDQRVVLSAALFRLLSGSASEGTISTEGNQISAAKQALHSSFSKYIDAGDKENQHGPAAQAGILAEHASLIVEAFTRAVVVVVAVDRTQTTAVFSVTAPTRKLEETTQGSRRRLGLPQPKARLEIDLLLPSGDADRQVEINVPAGVSIDAPAARRPRDSPGQSADLVVVVDMPPARERLDLLMTSLLGQPAPAVGQCFADLAIAQADTLAEVLSQHFVLSAEDTTADRSSGEPVITDSYKKLAEQTSQSVNRLGTIRAELRRLAAHDRAGSPAGDALKKEWDGGGWLNRALVRHASTSVPSPDTMTARVGLLENTGQRVTPRSAKVTLLVEVADAQFFSIARFSAAVSIVLMVVVACFFAFAAWRHVHDGTPSPEVLASALTLFSVIQAGRVEAPDRSTLRGKLTGPGNWLIIASILPTVVLAVALAFGITGWAAVSWAGATIVVQGLFMLAMWRGPLSAMGGRGRAPHRVLSTTPTPAYVKTAALHANWWRATTATALVVGRRAHGYLVWEHRADDTGVRRGERNHMDRALGDRTRGDSGHPPQAPSGALAAARSDGSASLPVPAGSGSSPASPDAARQDGPASSSGLARSRSLTGRRARNDQGDPDYQKGGNEVADRPADPAVQQAPSLSRLLGRVQPQIAGALAAARSASGRHAAERAPEVPGGARVQADTAGGPDGTTEHVAAAVGPVANILAMMRSGTTNEALTFMVLRERAGSRPNVVTVPLSIDPDRLPPVVALADHLDVIVGVQRDEDFLKLRDHPLLEVLRAAEGRRMPVVDVQLPVPPPDPAAPDGMLWARVRVGITESEYGQVTSLLGHDIAKLTAPTWVRVSPGRSARELRHGALQASPAVHGKTLDLLTARDLDVVSAAARRGLSPDSVAWRMLALCAHAGMGVERDMLDALGEREPGLQLAAVSYGLLHGMAVYLILGYQAPSQPGGRRTADPHLERDLAATSKAAGLRVLLDEWRTAGQLGFASDQPLMRVHVRTRDMPGTLQIVLNALHQALRQQLPALSAMDNAEWHVTLETGAGHIAAARLTLRLPVTAAAVRDWKPERWAAIARDARFQAADAVAERGPAGGSTGEEYRAPEDTVITVRPITSRTPARPEGDGTGGALQR